MRPFIRLFCSSFLLLLLLPLKGITQNVTLTTSATAAANVAQGANNNPIAYAVKMDIGASAVTVNSMQFTLSGTHDNNDINSIGIWFNATNPTIAGAILLNTATVGFAAPHTYLVSCNVPIAAGGSGYFMVSTNITATGTAGNTIKVDGAASPAIFGFTVGQVITNNQSDLAGLLTIIAGVATLTTSPVAAANIAQGTNSNPVVYAVKMDVTVFPVSINSIQFTLSGTHDNNDLSSIGIWFNGTTPSVSGGVLLNTATVGFAAPHTYIVSCTVPLAAGASGYFLITTNLSATATLGNTVKLNGATNPVVFGFTAGPSLNNNQTDVAGIQTILGAGATLTSIPLAAGNILQGTNFNPVYTAKMDITNLPLSVNNIQFTLSGSHDANDLTVATVWFNASAPILAGATNLASVPATFAATHTYSTGPVVANIATGGTGYFIITVSTDIAATGGNTVKIDGAVNPLIFSFATAPPVTNNQADLGGIQTITSTLPLKLISFTGDATNKQEVKLQWTTAGEFNTRDFDVQRSDDGLRFSTIGVIAAANSSTDQHYNYLHKLPLAGNNYYRLKMTDKDGQYTYSAVAKVNIAINATKLIVFQNPVTNIADLRVQASKNETIILHLYSADGKMISSKSFNVTKGNNQLSWNLQQLAAGSYFISSGNKFFESMKIIKH